MKYKKPYSLDNPPYAERDCENGVHLVDYDGSCVCGFQVAYGPSQEERLQGYAILRGDLRILYRTDYEAACFHCDRAYPTVSHLLAHLDDVLVCYQCGQEFLTDCQLAMHLEDCEFRGEAAERIDQALREFQAANF